MLDHMQTKQQLEQVAELVSNKQLVWPGGQSVVADMLRTGGRT